MMFSSIFLGRQVTSIMVVVVGVLGSSVILLVSGSQHDDVLDSKPSSSSSPSWIIHDPDTLVPCVKLRGTIEFQFKSNGWMPVPPSASASGPCQSLPGDYQDISIVWMNNDAEEEVEVGHGSSSSRNYSLYFGFVSSWESEFLDLNISSTQFALNSLSLTYYERNGTLVYPVSYSVSDFLIFPTPKENTFTCSSVNFQVGDLSMRIKDFQYQAFMTNQSSINEQLFLCPEDKERVGVWTMISRIAGYAMLGTLSCLILGMILYLLNAIIGRREDIMIRYRSFRNSDT